MYLHALATALPPASFSQADCWRIISESGALGRLSRRSRLILHSILNGNRGIARRHFALPTIERVFDLGADDLNAAFRTEAPALAGRALAAVLEGEGLSAGGLDALFICTCTGYLCPGVTSYVAEAAGVRADAFLQDFVGLGCGAAIPMMRAASHFIAARPDAVVACVAVEICSAAFYLDDDPGVLVSACLFGDGAAATLWRRAPGRRSAPGGGGLSAFGFDTVHQPIHRDRIRFEQRGGKLRNLLDPSVPALAAGAVGSLWERRGARPVGRVVTHAGGVDVLEALAPVLAPHSLEASVRVLNGHGNMSSPSVLFALEEALRTPLANGEGDLWLASFGAGFSAHSCRLGTVAP